MPPLNQKQLARKAVENALASGKLVKPDQCECAGCIVHPGTPCSATGRVEAHHPDHAYRLEIQWLCNPCHKAADHRTKVGGAEIARAVLLRSQGLSVEYIAQVLNVSSRTLRKYLK